jgi:hypothetical protein
MSLQVQAVLTGGYSDNPPASTLLYLIVKEQNRVGKAHPTVFVVSNNTRGKAASIRPSQRHRDIRDGCTDTRWFALRASSIYHFRFSIFHLIGSPWQRRAGAG